MYLTDQGFEGLEVVGEEKTKAYRKNPTTPIVTTIRAIP